MTEIISIVLWDIPVEIRKDPGSPWLLVATLFNTPSYSEVLVVPHQVRVMRQLFQHEQGHCCFSAFFHLVSMLSLLSWLPSPFSFSLYFLLHALPPNWPVTFLPRVLFIPPIRSLSLHSWTKCSSCLHVLFTITIYSSIHLHNACFQTHLVLILRSVNKVNNAAKKSIFLQSEEDSPNTFNSHCLIRWKNVLLKLSIRRHI